MKKQIRILIIIFVALGLPDIFNPQFSLVYADENFAIVWQANTEPDLAGYNVYTSIAGPGPPYDFLDSYTLAEIDDPDNPEISLTLSEEKVRNYIVVTAFDLDGFESEFSNEICVIMQNSKIIDCASAEDDDNDQNGNGGGGSDCFISVLSKSF